MPFIKYIDKKFNNKSLLLIDQANGIIGEYKAMGIQLTLRQLYYQFVSRDIIPNKQEAYDSLGELISNARLAGLVDWRAIEDRTRNVRQNNHWNNPEEVLHASAEQYAIDSWEGQERYVEVWVEKDALVGVVEQVASDMDVSYFACRGYVSQSEMWAGAMRLRAQIEAGRDPIILHLGDHDPSGIDMTRDNIDRLSMLAMHDIEVRRLALNMDQIKKYDPPPNPAKMSDSRAADYTSKYGYESWELDALEPRVTQKIIRDAIEDVLDADLRTEVLERQEKERQRLFDLITYLKD